MRSNRVWLMVRLAWSRTIRRTWARRGPRSSAGGDARSSAGSLWGATSSTGRLRMFEQLRRFQPSQPGIDLAGGQLDERFRDVGGIGQRGRVVLGNGRPVHRGVHVGGVDGVDLDASVLELGGPDPGQPVESGL